MLKKRLIFTLLYDSGHFVLSRNFRLQRVGDLEWLKRNYNFSHIAFFIDELIVLDITRENRDLNQFSAVLKELSANCFVPIAAGGGVRSVDDARTLLRSGADKIVINTPLFGDGELVGDLAVEFGQQCIVGSVDVKRHAGDDCQIYTEQGECKVENNFVESIQTLQSQLIGELYLNSIDQDGTGQGYDMTLLDQIPAPFSIPLILAGGVGNASHLMEGISDQRVDAVATAHLFNFVGNGLQRARELMVERGDDLAVWPSLAEMGLA